MSKAQVAAVAGFNLLGGWTATELLTDLRGVAEAPIGQTQRRLTAGRAA